MRNTGSTHGSGGERGASALYHPETSRADHELGFIARITPRRGARGVALAEKTPRGWARRTGRRAFTRVELCACLVAVALLALLALPALASTQSRGHVAQCLNNLRLMGRAVQVWASDNNSMMPPWRTLTSEGGTMPVSGLKAGNAWFEYWAISNQLSTPRILACPADEGVRVAKDFNELASPPFRNNGASYFINLHTSLENPQAALFGDRNLSLNPSTLCSLAGINNSLLFTTASAWTNAVHGPSGNLVTMDGRVSQTSTPEMQTALLRSQAEGPSVIHLLRAR